MAVPTLLKYIEAERARGRDDAALIAELVLDEGQLDRMKAALRLGLIFMKPLKEARRKWLRANLLHILHFADGPSGKLSREDVEAEFQSVLEEVFRPRRTEQRPDSRYASGLPHRRAGR